VLQLRGKALADKAWDLLGIFQEVLLDARLDNKDRFKQVTYRPPRLAACFWARLLRRLLAPPPPPPLLLLLPPPPLQCT
jgi:hypothetical protein